MRWVKRESMGSTIYYYGRQGLRADSGIYRQEGSGAQIVPGPAGTFIAVCWKKGTRVEANVRSRPFKKPEMAMTWVDRKLGGRP